MTANNRRHFPRQDQETTVQVILPPDLSPGGKNSCELIPAKLCNQSREGLCIQIDRTLAPESNINIKIVATEEPQPNDVYYMLEGRVVWCKNIDDETSRFGIGVKLLRKVVRADVLTSRFR